MATHFLLEGDDLAQLVAHVRDELGPRARVVRAERIRTGGVAGFFARERYELTVDVPDDEPPPGGPAEVPPGHLRRRHRAAGSIEDLVAAADAADVGDLVVPPPPPPPPPDAAPVVSTAGPDFAAVLEQVRDLAGVDTRADVVVPPPFRKASPPVLAGAAAAPPAPGAAPPAAPVDLMATLGALGVPAGLLRPGPVTYAAVLGRVPAAPRPQRNAGTAVVVIGDGPHALATAALLADRCGVPETGRAHVGAVPVVAPTGGAGRRLGGTADVAAWRAGIDHAPFAGVLAVCDGGDPQERAVTLALLQAARPGQVWAAVDAHATTEDSLRRLADLGGSRRIDALAVCGAFDAARPGASLGLGVPVGLLDGVPATRVAWAAALSQAADDVARWGG